MLTFKRGARRIVADYKSAEIYKHYKSKAKNPVDRETFWKVFKSAIYGKEDKYIGLIDRIILNNDCVRFPFRLGEIHMRRRKRCARIRKDGSLDKSILPVNWKATKELWEKTYPGLSPQEIYKLSDKRVVYNLNEHTNRYSCTMYWNKLTSNIPNQWFYRLEINRDHKHKIRDSLLANPNLINMYYE